MNYNIINSCNNSSVNYTPYKALLLYNKDTTKSKVSAWECRRCGNVTINSNIPKYCPVCYSSSNYIMARIFQNVTKILKLLKYCFTNPMKRAIILYSKIL